MDQKLSEAMDGRTKVWLSEKTGIPRTTLNNYFAGTSPSLENAYKVADALGKTVYDIWPWHHK